MVPLVTSSSRFVGLRPFSAWKEEMAELIEMVSMEPSALFLALATVFR